MTGIEEDNLRRDLSRKTAQLGAISYWLRRQEMDVTPEFDSPEFRDVRSEIQRLRELVHILTEGLGEVVEVVATTRRAVAQR